MHDDGVRRRISRFREGMEIARRFAYLNHASTGPLHRSTRRAVQRFLREQTWEASLGDPAWQQFMGEARASVGKLIGALPENVCLMPNCALGLIRALSSIDFREGDEVVYLHDEFATLYFALQGVLKRGARLVEVSAPFGADPTPNLLEAITSRTRLVAVSWVGFLTGYRVDLYRLSEAKSRRGFYLLVDGYQGIGVVPLDLAQLSVDFLVCGGAKWLLSPLGSGFMYVSTEALKEHHPDWPGWFGMEVDPTRYCRREVPPKQTAVRFESGTNPLPGMYGMKRSLDDFAAIGVGAIWARVQELTAHLLAGLDRAGVHVLTPRAPGLRAGIITFQVPQAEALLAALGEAGVIVSLRDGLVRVSPHFWNTEEELDRLLATASGA